MATTTAPAAAIVDNGTDDATSIDAQAFNELKAFPRALGAAYAVEGGGRVRLTTGQAARMALFDERVNCLADCHTEIDQEPFLSIG